MRIIKAFTSLVAIGIFSVMFLTVTTPLVYASSGGSGEPGDLCEVPSGYVCEYVEPKYTGTIAGYLEGGNIYIYTPCPLYQVGKTDRCFKCYIYIPDYNPFIRASDKLPSKAKDLKGFCALGLEDYNYVGFLDQCGGWGYYELVEVHDLKVSGNTFTFHGVIRPVNCY